MLAAKRAVEDGEGVGTETSLNRLGGLVSAVGRVRNGRENSVACGVSGSGAEGETANKECGME